MRTLLALSLLVLSACDSLVPLNSTTPSYVKQVAAYKEGSEGVAIYIVLADASGAMTTAKGVLTASISETKHDYSLNAGLSQRDIPLFELTKIGVDRSSFRRAKVGMGAFEHELILLPLGRIPYQRFWHRPSELSGKVKVDFVIEGGDTIHVEDTIIF